MPNPQHAATSASVPCNHDTVHCPVCRKRLSEFLFNGVEVDVCDSGCGIWLDFGELSTVEKPDFEEIDKAFVGEFVKKPVKEAMKVDGERHCPRDRMPLNRYEWNLGSGVVMDGCAHCHGLWLDAGEVEGYAKQVKNFRDNPPEISPELKAKLDAVEAQMEKDFESALDGVTRQTVRWDAFLLDDVLRGVMKGILRHL